MKKIQLTVFMAGLFFSSSNLEAQSTPFLTSGLVAYYAFNGNANDTFATNNGTPYNITYVADRFGNTNAAGSFAGSSTSYIDLSTTNCDLVLPFSVSVWVSYNNSGRGGPRIFSTSGYEITLATSGQSQTSPINLDGIGPACTSTNAIEAGVWSHIVGVWTTNAMSIYINGVALGSSPTTSPPDYSRWPNARIGGNSGKLSDDNYGGLIDDLAIYNRALSAQEVSALYAAKSPVTPGIVLVPTITFNGTVGMNYNIDYATNLSSPNWTVLTNVFLQTTNYLFPDFSAIGQPQRFYLVVPQ